MLGAASRHGRFFGMAVLTEQSHQSHSHWWAQNSDFRCLGYSLNLS